ncbi:MAG TPA: glutamate racemase [Desulfotomaculum sp.]|nr:glutamate racemase [Desulfotomaculum sp.]
MSDSRPVGLFDSGIGGLTVSREVFRLLPNEATVYFGDTAHVPYGSRRAEELIGFADQIIAFLILCNVKYIIFACNTNSSLSLPVMRRRYAVPMMGLVEPGARLAVELSANHRVGVIATEATVKSGAYQRAVRSLNPGITVFAQPAPRLVPLVEAGMSETREACESVSEYVQPLKSAGIDTLILGCTHYPFLVSCFQKCLGPEVKLVDPAAATVLAARDEIERLGLLNNLDGTPRHRYFVSGDPEDFRQTARQFPGFDALLVQRVVLEETVKNSGRGLACQE